MRPVLSRKPLLLNYFCPQMQLKQEKLSVLTCLWWRWRWVSSIPHRMIHKINNISVWKCPGGKEMCLRAITKRSKNKSKAHVVAYIKHFNVKDYCYEVNKFKLPKNSLEHTHQEISTEKRSTSKKMKVTEKFHLCGRVITHSTDGDFWFNFKSTLWKLLVWSISMQLEKKYTV